MPEKPAATPVPASITPPATRPASPAASASPKAAAAATAQPAATASNNTWGALTFAGVLYIGAPLFYKHCFSSSFTFAGVDLFEHSTCHASTGSP